MFLISEFISWQTGAKTKYIFRFLFGVFLQAEQQHYRKQISEEQPETSQWWSIELDSPVFRIAVGLEASWRDRRSRAAPWHCRPPAAVCTAPASSEPHRHNSESTAENTRRKKDETFWNTGNLQHESLHLSPGVQVPQRRTIKAIAGLDRTGLGEVTVPLPENHRAVAVGKRSMSARHSTRHQTNPTGCRAGAPLSGFPPVGTRCFITRQEVCWFKFQD